MYSLKKTLQRRCRINTVKLDAYLIYGPEQMSEATTTGTSVVGSAKDNANNDKSNNATSLSVSTMIILDSVSYILHPHHPPNPTNIGLRDDTQGPSPRTCRLKPKVPLWFPLFRPIGQPLVIENENNIVGSDISPPSRFPLYIYLARPEMKQQRYLELVKGMRSAKLM